MNYQVDKESKRIVAERWYNENGNFDRPDDLPCTTTHHYNSNHTVTQRWYDGVYDKLHRTGDKPAEIITIANTGVLLSEAFFKHGVLHRADDKPASVLRNQLGRMEEKSYWADGKLHRPRKYGPAKLRYDTETSLPITIEYWEHGRRVLPNFDSSGPVP